MGAVRKFGAKIAALFGRNRFEREMAEEMRLHLEMQEAANHAAGMSADDARYAALRQFGGVTQVQERCREQRGFRWFSDLLRDLRFAVRQLGKAPGFTAVAVLTLALGIGVNTSAFSLFKGIVFRPLPGVPDAKEMVAVFWTTRGGDTIPISRLELQDFQERTQTLAGLESTGAMPFSLENGQRPLRVWGEFVTGGHHALLGVSPFLGRMIVPADDRYPGAPLVVVLSYAFWQSQFGGDADVVGRSVRLNGKPCTVVGVAQPEFCGTTVGFRLDVFVPTAAAEQLRPFGGDGSDLFTRRDNRGLAAVGRLKPGCTLAQARAETAMIGAAIAREHPEFYEGLSATLVPFSRSPFGAQTYVGPMFAMMLGMAALVLLIMCANIANLLLVRGAARQREVAIRAALGADRGRLIRQFLGESLLLAFCGGALGGLMAMGMPSLIQSVWPTTLRIPLQINVEADATVLVFSVLVSFVSAFAFGLLPALQGSRQSVVPALKGGAPDGEHRHRWGRGSLVALQIAVSMPLLVAAGLLWRSAVRQKQADPGFETERLALLTIDLRPNGYEADRGLEFCRRLREEIGGLPGVAAVSLANQLPLQIVPRETAQVKVAGAESLQRDAAMPLVNAVTPGYFGTMGIALVAGREFTDADRADGAAVAVVNETMAHRYWPGKDPIGLSFEAQGRAITVVGVAKDVPYLSFAAPPQSHFYVPFAQHYMSEMIVQVRTAGNPAQLLKSMQDCIARMDPQLPVFGVETMGSYMDFALSMPTFAANGLLFAGVLGLALTAMGVFGTVSFTTSRRTREIGVRMALGATRANVVSLVVGQAARTVVLGVVIGLAASAIVPGAIGSMLYRTAAMDLPTFVAVLVMVAGTALIACWLPAQRATRIDPAETMRAD